MLPIQTSSQPTIIPLPTSASLPCIASPDSITNQKNYDCMFFTIRVPSDWMEEQSSQNAVSFFNPASNLPVTGSPDYEYPRDKGKIRIGVDYEKTSLSILEYIQQFDTNQRKVGLTVQGKNTPCIGSNYACVERKYTLYGKNNYEFILQNPQKTMIVTLSAGLNYIDFMPLIQSIFLSFRFK
ncbi:MAG TPA: hypothetical protein VLF89_04025 [Candidatus Saccharimonadales bacterium]|nr:hypothetical protein [Candidatus Saccharimonadales bacterium]